MRFFAYLFAIFSAVLFLVRPAYAQNAFYTLINKIITLVVNPVIWFLLVAAGLIFLWGVVQFIVSSGSGNEDGIEKGKKHIVWGLAGIFIMLSSKGIIFIIQDFFR